jgi:prolyl oligopeptidase
MIMRTIQMAVMLLVSAICLSQEIIKPQSAAIKPVNDNYYGITVKDPYRYLENLEDPEVISWMKYNAHYAKSNLHQIPGRQEMPDNFFVLDSRVSSRIQNTKLTTDGKHFYLKLRPEDENGKLFFRTGYHSEEKLLFDPDTYKNEDKA